MSKLVLLENVTLSRNHDWKNPYELWMGNVFDFTQLRSFECLCYVNLPKQKKYGKFGDTAVKGSFLVTRLVHTISKFSPPMENWSSATM